MRTSKSKVKVLTRSWVTAICDVCGREETFEATGTGLLSGTSWKRLTIFHSEDDYDERLVCSAACSFVLGGQWMLGEYEKEPGE